MEQGGAVSSPPRENFPGWGRSHYSERELETAAP
jgi:hypothetical protein